MLWPPGTLSREWLDQLVESEEASVELNELSDRGEDKGVKGHPGQGGDFGFPSKCDEGPDRTVQSCSLIHVTKQTVSFWRNPLAALERTPWMGSLG